MDEIKAERLQEIIERYQDEIKEIKSNKAPRKFYSQMFKAYVIQYALDFGEHSKLSRATGISRLLIKKWAKLSRRTKREKESESFQQLKIVYKRPGNLV